MTEIKKITILDKPFRPVMRWFESLHFRFAVSQFLLLVFIIGTTCVIIVTVERKLLLSQGYDLAAQLGSRVVSQLQGRIMLAESVVVSLAGLGGSLERNVETYKKVVPSIIDYKGEESFIAGGGIWPEPFRFAADVERRSFFWGRDKNGGLQYFDDYNAPEGMGYHHEEWYVPALFYPPGKGFWSKSYMDPYSYQPMVTCSVPIYENNQVTGVATVDLKLEGLQSFFIEASKELGGYIFAVDRNNKLLSFPVPEEAKLYGTDEKQNRTEEFLNARSLAGKFPAFQPLSDLLDSINRDTIVSAGSHQDFNAGLARKIDELSYQINQDEAVLTVAILNDVVKESGMNFEKMDMRRVLIQKDPLLNKEVMAFVFQMPRTYWKVIVVVPTSKFLVVADAATRKVASYIIVLEVLALIIMFFIMRKSVIGPIRRMALQVNKISGDQKILEERLDDSPRHELGELAYEFNYRTDWLASALEQLNQMNEQLEERVRQRTDELNRILKELENTHMQLLQSEKLASIGQLAAGVAHEINNPVGFINNNMTVLHQYVADYNKMLGMVRELRQTIREGNIEQARIIADRMTKFEEEINLDFIIEDADKLLSHNQKGLQRIQKIVLDLRTFSREDKDSMELVRIEEVIDSILGMVHSELRYKAELVKNYGETAMVKCNSQRLGQVFINLFVNAAQAMDERGTIEVRTYQEGKFVCIDVRDTGKGIPPENLQKIFDPFFTTKPVGQGTGLGLSVSYEIIKKHEGEIRVKSEVGKGTTFTILLPIR